MRVLALDYGLARTGVAVSDPTGIVARPLGVVERAGSEAGLARLAELARAQEADLIVVGLPVETFDERFTTRLAQSSLAAGAGAEEDALAAAHLLTTYLEWLSARRT